MFACSCKKLLRWLKAEHVEDDLDALDVRIGNRFERLVHPFHAHAIEAKLPLLHQVVEDAKDLGHVIDFGRWTVQLEEVNRLCLQIPQAPFDKAGQVLAVIATRRVRIEPSSCLGGNNQLLATRFANLSDQLL